MRTLRSALNLSCAVLAQLFHRQSALGTSMQCAIPNSPLSPSTHGPNDDLVLTNKSLKILLSGGTLARTVCLNKLSHRARRPHVAFSSGAVISDGSWSWRSL
jgi:hypothetical protein